MQITRPMARTLARLLTALTLLASFRAHAEGAAGAPPEASPSPTAQEVEAAIAVQSGRRRGGITAIVIGSIAIVGGAVVSTIQTSETCPMLDQNCQKEDKLGPALVGLAIGIPCLIGGVSTLRDSSGKLLQLRQQRSRLSLSPGTDSLRLTLMYDF